MRRIYIGRVPDKPDRLRLSYAFDEGLNAVVRAVPGRAFDKASKTWDIPFNPTTYDAFKHRLPQDVAIVIDQKLLAELQMAAMDLKRAQAARDRGDSDFAFDYKTTPYAHQRAGLAFLAHAGGGALLWEMGLGKTKTAIDFCEWLRQQLNDIIDVLVITPNSVKRNWCDEIAKHAGHTSYIVPEGRLADRVKQLAGARYTIVNPEALSLKPLAPAIVAYPWTVVIVDEATRFKSWSAARTKALHKVKAKYRVILTGTPITGKGEDAWSAFEWMRPGTFGSWYAFRDHYMAKDYWGRFVSIRSDRDQELREKLGELSYRILKRDVLDLPEKVYTDRRVDLSGDQLAAYESMRKNLYASVDQASTSASTILTQLLRLTQITAGMVGAGDRYLWLKDNAKEAELAALLDEMGDEPVVVYGLYQRELQALALRFGGGQHVGSSFYNGIIYGPTPERDRHLMVEQFQAGQRNRLFVQTHTGGIGINLTAARTAIYYTRGWSLEDYLQSQDRLHRIGQTGTVTIVHLVANHTVDEHIAKALSTKQDLADRLTGDDARRLAALVLEGKDA